jgi:hypothetical protein
MKEILRKEQGIRKAADFTHFTIKNKPSTLSSSSDVGHSQGALA